MLAMNEALVLAALRQQELTDAAESLNVRLQKEIDERIQAEVALRASETRLRNLNADLERRVLEGSRELGRNNLIDAIESLDHGLVLYDHEDRLVLFNQHLYDQYPLANGHFAIGQTFEQIFRVLVDCGAVTVPPGESAQQFIADSVARHKRADGTVAEVVQPDGRVLHVTEHRSKSQGFVSIARDVTKQLKLAEQARESQKMEAIGRLTGGLAHDLNNYLAVVLGNLDLLAEQPNVDATARKLIDGAIAGTLRGGELIRSLLAFSRRQPLAPRVIDVGQHVAEVTNLVKRTIGENIVVDLRVADDLWPVTIDAAQLDSCVINLANNAHDAMPAGGRLSIALSNVSLRDETSTEEGASLRDHVQIEFADTGTGMGEAVLARAFEPFFTTKGPGHGTGLGLSMVHGFVHQSGGFLRVDSTPGAGTIVRLYLPRTVDAGVDQVNSPKVEALPGGHERILLVEDHEEMCAVVAAQLGSLGYATVAVDNGEAALALLDEQAGSFDLVFSDIVMPGRIDGLELARRARERWPDLRVLLTSGFAGSVVRAEYKKAPGVLRKPYRKADLARAVRGVLDGAQPKARK
ncbi:MAG: response regulator [Reyranella sp.]|nr:response regulator [Reyranella sp.]